MTNKFMTEDVKAAIEAIKNYEEIDPRFERLKIIMSSGLREKLANGMSQKTAFALVGKAVAGGQKMEFSTFSKMLSKLTSKKRRTPAQKDAAAAAAAAVAQTATARAERRAQKKSTPAPASSTDLENDPFAPAKV